MAFTTTALISVALVTMATAVRSRVRVWSMMLPNSGCMVISPPSEEYLKNSRLVACTEDIAYLTSREHVPSPAPILHGMAVSAGMIAIVNDISHDADGLDRVFFEAERLFFKFHRTGTSRIRPRLQGPQSFQSRSKFIGFGPNDTLPKGVFERDTGHVQTSFAPR